jgi:hypothetical protein
MCALCGAFGGTEHWSNESGAAGRAKPPAADRSARAAMANRVLGLYGLHLSEWGGRFTLASRTGGMVIVDHFGALWSEAERLGGRPCDPLDRDVIEAVERIAKQP